MIALTEESTCADDRPVRRTGRCYNLFLMKRVPAPILGVFAILFFFREFPQSRFVHVTGDLGDSRFILGILEYWFQFFNGQAAFASPQFFYPQNGVLGFSESAFLLALPYSLFRLFIPDIYLAFEWTVISVHCIGFCSFYLLLRRWLDLQPYTAAFGALLFSISNLYYASAYQVHLRAVNFIPLIVWLFIAARDLRLLHPRRAVLASSAAAALSALLFFTSFYIGWFLFLMLGVGICLYLLAVLSGGVAAPKFWPPLALILTPIVTFLICLVPFLVTYLPAMRQTGDRPYALALFFSPIPEDLVNVGGSNLAWGWTSQTILRHLQTRPNYWEFERGWPIIMALTFLFAGIGAFMKLWRERPAPPDRRTLILGIVFATVCLCWLLELKWRQYSLWWLVYHLVPGAGAIRVPVRFNFVLNVGVVLVCAAGVERLAQARRYVKKSYATAGVIILCAAMVLEQVNTVSSHLVNRVAEQRRLQVPAPPTSCSAFYVNPAAGRPALWTNIDAILIAEKVHMPTINGYSGWFPNGWNLLSDPPVYAAAVRQWSLLNGPLKGLCALDVPTGSWQVHERALANYYHLGDTIDFRRGGDSQLYALDGWGEEEPDGRWTVGEYSRLILPLATPIVGPLELTIECNGFNPDASPHSTISLEVNGQAVLHRTTPQQQAHWTIQFDGRLLRSGDNILRFHISNPRTPSDFGSPDIRKLGIALQSLTVKRSR